MKIIFTWLMIIASGFVCTAQLQVLTYNIRYDNAADGNNAWPNRRQSLCDSLKALSADIVCLQEVLNSQYLFIQSRLGDYHAYGIGRDDGKLAGEYAPVFFKKSKYILLDSGTFWLSENPDTPGKSWDAALNRIVTWVKLKSIDGKRVFFVFNTHFDHQGKVARLHSAELVTHKAKEMATSYPFIIAGDFNLTPSEEPYHIMARNLKDAYKPDSSGADYTFAGFKYDEKIAKRIDYIFYSNAFKSSNYQTLNWRSAWGDFLSDHLPTPAH